MLSLMMIMRLPTVERARHMLCFFCKYRDVTYIYLSDYTSKVLFKHPVLVIYSVIF
jgi:hypothetical protein